MVKTPGGYESDAAATCEVSRFLFLIYLLCLITIYAISRKATKLIRLTSSHLHTFSEIEQGMEYMATLYDHMDFSGVREIWHIVWHMKKPDGFDHAPMKQVYHVHLLKNLFLFQNP